MNKVILLGRLTKDVELKYTQTSNTAVASFSIAVNRRYAKQGETRETDFFNVIAWKSLAETISKYLQKGMQVLILGRLQTRTWDDEQGQKHYVTEVIAEEIDFIGSKKDNTENNENANGTMPEIQDFEDFSVSGDDLPF